MEFVADFHIHSKYSRATSKDMSVPQLSQWAKLKGIDLLGSGDFTHHVWLQELKQYLEPKGKTGLYIHKGIHYILTAEISSIYSQKGQVYRVHNIIMAPSFELVEEINRMLAVQGNLAADGRPILGLSCYQLAESLFQISQEIMLVPAHIWTPWFSVFGSKSGFNSLEEAFGKYTEKITALETGLSSDPAMNWMVSRLDCFSLISNSDAHSPSRIGREANVFDCELSYSQIREVLKKKDKTKFLYTIEFFPEEGKYHYDGHRNCSVRLHPHETKKYNGLCPACKKPVTKGVLYRVEELADRPYGFVPQNAIPFKSLVPLDEIIAEVKGVSNKESKAVSKDYMDAVYNLGSEFKILVKTPLEELFARLPERLASGIQRVREKKLTLLPGYDGEYGTIKIFDEQKESQAKGNEQLTLF